MRSVIYARVSTRGQAAEDKVSIPDQIEKGKHFIESHGWILAHDPFVDAGISGQKFEERKALQDMLEFIRQGKADLVVVYDSDRIGRRSSVSQQIYGELDKYNVQIFSISQPVEPKTPASYDPMEDDSGFITRSVTSMTSELFIRRLRRNIRVGRKNRVMRGKLYARVPFGYRYHYATDGAKNLVIAEEDAAVVRKIYHSYLDGKSMRTISAELNRDGIKTPRGSTWSTGSLVQVLENAHYCGKVYMGRTVMKAGKQRRAAKADLIIAKGEHSPIISEEIWEKVQELRKKKQQFGKSGGDSHVLAGLGKCGICGYSMVVIKSITSTKYNTKTPYLICGSYQQRGLCERNGYRADDLLKDLLDYLSTIAKNPSLIEKLKSRQSKEKSTEVQDTIIALEKQAEQLKQRQQKSRYAFETGVDSLVEYQKHKTTLSEEEEKVSARLHQMHEEVAKIERAKAVEKHFTDLIADIPGNFVDQPLAKRKMLLRSILERIEITRQRFHLVFKF